MRMAKRYYAIMHRPDGVAGGMVSVGGTIGHDDAETLEGYMRERIWRRGRRPTIGRIYRSDTEELVREFKL
jgi:hypothetical protein